MAVNITVSDLQVFEPSIDESKAQAMIVDAVARAAVVAPCILEPEFAHNGAAEAVIKGAILRWNEQGTGALSQQSAGPFQASFDTRQQRKALFWPSEITELQALCNASGGSGAFSIDTAPQRGPQQHADICTLNFGGEYCSCGAVLTNLFPLYEQ